jgi:PhoPQ-activated pathogenicity-related protein
MRVLASIWEDNINLRYDYRQALYDHVTTAAMSKLPVVVDPLAMRQRSYIDIADRAFSLMQVS